MDMSYGEKSAWVSLATMVAAYAWYFSEYGPALAAGELVFGDIFGALIGLVILIVIVEVILHVALGLDIARSGADAEVTGDERDALIEVRANSISSYVLGAGAITGIFCAALQTPVVTAHVLLLSLVAAETVKLVTQLVYYRRGI